MREWTWITVAERMPENEQRVIVRGICGGKRWVGEVECWRYDVAKYTNWRRPNNQLVLDVTHWMPMPPWELA